MSFRVKLWDNHEYMYQNILRKKWIHHKKLKLTIFAILRMTLHCCPDYISTKLNAADLRLKHINPEIAQLRPRAARRGAQQRR